MSANQVPTAQPQLRQQIRQQIRQLRRALSQAEQQAAAFALCQQILQLPETQRSQHIALYFSQDGEIDTAPLFQALWQQGKQLYLPVLHPVVAGHLLFQQYSMQTPMRLNKYRIAEPRLNCAELCPLPQLDLLLMPLVAFDQSGNRLGMGGGYYDRTLARIAPGQPPTLIGLAHQCQQVAQLPQANWDIPMPLIATPAQCFRFYSCFATKASPY